MMTSHYTWGSVTTLHDFGGCLVTAFRHFVLDSHNFMVTTLGLCVNWPLPHRISSNIWGDLSLFTLESTHMENHHKYIIFRGLFFKSVAPLHTPCHLAYVIPGWNLAKYALWLPTTLMQAPGSITRDSETSETKRKNQCALHLIYSWNYRLQEISQSI